MAKVNRTGHASLQFGPGETFLAPPTTVEWEPVPPWPMPTDLAALPRLAEKDAVPGWPAWLGTPQGAARYRSDARLEVFEAVRREIPEFFRGDGWLEKALDPDPKRRLPEARILSR